MNDRCIHGLESLPASVRGCVLTIGNFDGVHIGHQRILRTARSLGDQEGAAVVAMTFDPPPDIVLRPHDAPHRITPSKERIRLLLECGSDRVVIVLTDKQFLTTTPQDFIENILVARFAPKHVVEGQNFFFGHKRSGNVETLAEASGRGGFRLHVVDPVMLDLGEGPTRISSTLIRSLILAGQIVEATRCLGRQFSLFGRVVTGTGRGRRLLGYPTLNLQTGEQVCPGDGVYAGKAVVGEQEYSAAVSIGENPTLGGAGRTVEAYLLDCEGDFRGQEVELRFTQRIGDQRRFESVDALKAQIAKDVKRAREILG